MAEKSLSLDELVRKLMGDEHADVLRETLAWFVGELMEVEVNDWSGEATPEGATGVAGRFPGASAWGPTYC